MHEGHRQRLRTRFMNEGLDNFEPHEVLELLLFYAKSRGDTNPVAHRLIRHFGSLAEVFNAPMDELLALDGVGEISATLIKMIPALSRRYMLSMESDRPPEILSNSIRVRQYLLPRYIGRTVETLFLLCLDNQSRPLACVQISEGSVNATQVDMRRIAEVVLRVRASGVILSHNHPNGYAFPTREDIEVTEKVEQFLRSMGIELVDHIIIAGTDAVSFVDSGYLKRNI